jgi:hypothetical protein
MIKRHWTVNCAHPTAEIGVKSIRTRLNASKHIENTASRALEALKAIFGTLSTFSRARNTGIK